MIRFQYGKRVLCFFAFSIASANETRNLESGLSNPIDVQQSFTGDSKMNVQFADQQPTPMPPSMLHGTEINVPPSPADPLGSTQALILEHLPMVRFIARRMYERLPQHTELDDLISAGLLGLVDAASKFDGTKQIQFKSYAQHRIRGAILDSLRLLDWSPRDLRRKGRAIAETTRKLSAQLSRMPTDE
ncbi:MAG TPA: sigma-70 family RNA polymerase sigma factor, partial [Acidobacteriaceae bacterium]|nr:sigma-70 family RNA polymerase sigma factor [Acidobacteriaceae bacterium]